jgi:hypothetical protein
MFAVLKDREGGELDRPSWTQPPQQAPPSSSGGGSARTTGE